MRKLLVLAALCVAGVVGSADEASAFGRRKKKADCVPVAPVVTYAQPACGCGGYGTVGGVYSGSGYGSSYYGAQPYQYSSGYWNAPSSYYGGTMHGYPGGFGGYGYYR
jgi:hypothetical protein